jgi:hypothetical protein
VPSMVASTGADGASGKGYNVSFEGERGWRASSSHCSEGGRRPTQRRQRRNERQWWLRGHSARGGKRRGGLARLEGGGGPREVGKREQAGLEGKEARSIKKAEALLGCHGK